MGKKRLLLSAFSANTLLTLSVFGAVHLRSDVPADPLSRDPASSVLHAPEFCHLSSAGASVGSLTSLAGESHVYMEQGPGNP